MVAVKIPWEYGVCYDLTRPVSSTAQCRCTTPLRPSPNVIKRRYMVNHLTIASHQCSDHRHNVRAAAKVVPWGYQDTHNERVLTPETSRKLEAGRVQDCHFLGPLAASLALVVNGERKVGYVKLVMTLSIYTDITISHSAEASHCAEARGNLLQAR